MLWPDYNEVGDLPPGLYGASLDEVLRQFGRDKPKRDKTMRGIVEVTHDQE